MSVVILNKSDMAAISTAVSLAAASQKVAVGLTVPAMSRKDQSLGPSCNHHTGRLVVGDVENLS